MWTIKDITWSSVSGSLLNRIIDQDQVHRLVRENVILCLVTKRKTFWKQNFNKF
jgi:hypothetical protein